MDKRYKLYIVAVENQNWASLELTSFHSHLINHSYIMAWWHYLKSVYLIKVDSNISSIQITNMVRNIMECSIVTGISSKEFLVIEFCPKNYSGWLPKPAWEWFKSENKKKSNS